MKYQVKGTALAGTKSFLDARMHDGYFEQEARKVGLIQHGMILASSWYAAELAFQLFKNAGKDLGMDPYQLTKHAVQEGTENDLNSIYRFFMKLGGAERVLTKAPQMANTYANYYRYDMVLNEPGVHEFTISDVPEDLSLWTQHIIEGALTGVLKACGKEINSFEMISYDEYVKKGQKFQNLLMRVKY